MPQRLAILRLLIVAIIGSMGGCAGAAVAPTSRPAAGAAPPLATSSYHLHLPGISGYRSIDRNLTRGLADGGLGGMIDHYDWTTADPGLGSLLAYKRNQREAGKVAQILLEHFRADPHVRITVTAHSGGCAIIAWALEKLPADVKIDSVVMLAPALSPGYDLTDMLRHVRGHLYVFYSRYDDIVLGLGTRLFGTMDGMKTEAAGKVGFMRPECADPVQYRKLIQFPYEKDWLTLGDIGDHVGTMSYAFGKEVIAPLLLTGHLPAIHASASSNRGSDMRLRASTSNPPLNSR